MIILKTRKELLKHRENLNGTIGLVPTMGNLHQGHLSLIKQSISENQTTIVTIFVNPKQFGPNEDFNKYPRTLEADISKIDELGPGKDVIVFAPSTNEEIYPNGFATTISVNTDFKDILCGESRPGHFDGVTTVVQQLFSLTRPTTSYFGQKDYQQFKTIERMCIDLNIPLQLKLMPIIREEDGLALSSRNQYLEPEEERPNAIELYETLLHLKDIVEGEKVSDIEMNLVAFITLKLDDDKWEYLEILDAKSLTPVTDESKQAVIAGAFKLGKTRLIDNVLVDLC